MPSLTSATYTHTQLNTNNDRQQLSICTDHRFAPFAVCIVTSLRRLDDGMASCLTKVNRSEDLAFRRTQHRTPPPGELVTQRSATTNEPTKKTFFVSRDRIGVWNRFFNKYDVAVLKHVVLVNVVRNQEHSKAGKV